MAIPFQTPVNEQSFSSLIDDAVLATGKPGQIIAAVQFANLVVLECQALGLFAQDMIEDSIAVPAGQATPVTWVRPARFKSLRTVKYVNACSYPELALPGKKQRDKSDYFYAADNYFVFSGARAGETIALAIYYWQRRLAYYSMLGVNTATFPGGPYATRPAYLDQDLGTWKYLNIAGTVYVDTLGDPVVEAQRQLQALNWLVLDWRPLILSGVKAKMWNSSGDPRGNIEYGVYKQLQKSLQFTSSYEGEGL